MVNNPDLGIRPPTPSSIFPASRWVFQQSPVEKSPPRNQYSLSALHPVQATPPALDSPLGEKPLLASQNLQSSAGIPRPHDLHSISALR